MAKKTHSKDFKKWSDKYKRRGVTKEQLARLVDLGVLYDWEYEEITGEPYGEA